MKSICALLCIVFLHFHSDLLAQSTFTAVVTRIIDGDSVVLKRGKKNIEVRMYGIDCPEWKQYFSAESRNFTSSLLYNQKVTVAPQYYDSYGRLVALLFKNGQDVNGALVKSGIAWVYRKYCRKDVCKTWLADQKVAKEQRMGLWQR